MTTKPLKCKCGTTPVDRPYKWEQHPNEWKHRHQLVCPKCDLRSWPMLDLPDCINDWNNRVILEKTTLESLEVPSAKEKRLAEEKRVQSLKSKRIRRPKEFEKDDCHLDFYGKQFASVGSPIHVKVIIDRNTYDSSVTDLMRRQARFMLKAADWVDDQVKKGRLQ